MFSELLSTVSVYVLVSLFLAYRIFLHKNVETVFLILFAGVVGFMFKFGFNFSMTWITFELLYYFLISRDFDTKRFQTLQFHVTFSIFNLLMLYIGYSDFNFLNLALFFVIGVFFLNKVVYNNVMTKDFIYILQSVVFLVLFVFINKFQYMHKILFICLVILFCFGVFYLVFHKNVQSKQLQAVHNTMLIRDILPSLILFILLFTKFYQVDNIVMSSENLLNLIVIVMTLSVFYKRINTFLIDLVVYFFIVHSHKNGMYILMVSVLIRCFVENFISRLDVKMNLSYFHVSVFNPFNIITMYIGLKIGISTQVNMLYVLCVLETFYFLNYQVYESELTEC